MKWGYKHCFVNCFTRFDLWWYNEVKQCQCSKLSVHMQKKLTFPYTPHSGAINPVPNKLCERIVWWGQRKEIEPQSSRKDYRGMRLQVATLTPSLDRKRRRMNCPGYCRPPQTPSRSGSGSPCLSVATGRTSWCLSASLESALDTPSSRPHI